MSSLPALLALFRQGVFVGLALAVPVGPMAMLCMQRTIAYGMPVGVATGLAAATVNVMYGGLALTGLALTDAGSVAPGSHAMRAIGSLLLLRLAVRTMLRTGVPSASAATPKLTRRAAFLSALLVGATNPAALISTLALLGPLSAPTAPAPMEAAAILAGMFAAAGSWWVCFSAAAAILRTRLDAAVLRAVNRTAGVLLSLYAAWALASSIEWRTLPF